MDSILDTCLRSMNSRWKMFFFLLKMVIEFEKPNCDTHTWAVNWRTATKEFFVPCSTSDLISVLAENWCATYLFSHFHNYHRRSFTFCMNQVQTIRCFMPAFFPILLTMPHSYMQSPRSLEPCNHLFLFFAIFLINFIEINWNIERNLTSTTGRTQKNFYSSICDSFQWTRTVIFVSAVEALFLPFFFLE